VTRSRLKRGDLLPEMRSVPPGKRSRAWSRRLAAVEAPGINTLSGEAPSLLWQEACGANVLDVDGNRYLDLTAGFGVAAIGHRHPAVVAAVRRQSSKLLHGLADVHAHPLRVELAERLLERSPIKDAQVYFAVSGADAVEIALKTALLSTGRPEILAFHPAYHGTSLGALAATSRPEFRDPFRAQLHQRVHRLPFACPAGRVEEVLTRHAAIGALLVEPVVGREGVLVPPPGWLHDLAALSRAHDVCFVVDEVFTGFGRTGRWFAIEGEAAAPDLLCCGKALGGGLPIAAVIGERGRLAAWRTDGEALHTGTFVGHPLACAAALAVLSVLESDALVERAARLGDWLAARLERIAASGLRRCRGRGLLFGIELETAAAARQASFEARRRGVLVLGGGPEGRVLQLCPPLTITETQLAAALDLLESSLPPLAGPDQPDAGPA
jgi:4-aminobutyrate aminotransferase-like enzyme